MKLKSLFLISSALVLLTGCASSSENNVINNASSEEEIQSYKIGDTVKVGNYEITVNSATNSKEVGSEYLRTKTENNFVTLNVKLKNCDKSELTIYGSMIVYHIGESQYEPAGAGIYLDNGFYYSYSIGAGLIKTIDIVYEIPSNFSPNDYLEAKETSRSSKGLRIYLNK